MTLTQAEISALKRQRVALAESLAAGRQDLRPQFDAVCEQIRAASRDRRK